MLSFPLFFQISHISLSLPLPPPPKKPKGLDGRGAVEGRRRQGARRPLALDRAGRTQPNRPVHPDGGGRGHGRGRRVVQQALAGNATFLSAALPSAIYPPLFNRYEPGMSFGNHVDNALRYLPGGSRVRTDISATLFLSAPDEYDGGELSIEDTFGTHSVKLPAGHMVVYPSTSLHRVEPVTRGERLASFFWVESMVRCPDQRRLLFDMDMNLLALRQRLGETAETLALTGTYHNLLRLWAST